LNNRNCRPWAWSSTSPRTEPGARSMNASPWKSLASSEMLQARAALLAGIRDFFRRRDVLEVETPILSAAGNSDPGLKQWRTQMPESWLRTSPEYAMKRLLAGGSGDIYELGRVFRGDESGRFHNREFTLLEWYRVGWTYHELMDEVAELVAGCGSIEILDDQRLSYRELFQTYAGIDPFHDDDDSLRGRLDEAGLSLDGADRQECLDLLLGGLIQPQLKGSTLTFVYDFPPEQAALARIRPGRVPVAERFELFLGKVELANGYQELTDATELRRRFEQENRRRAERGDPDVPLDEHLLEAMHSGLPESAGVALGVDRLLMIAMGAGSLQEVLAFPADRA
jgi:lysyl-tRNA synthetase class 2